MADFVQSSETKSAIRELADPIEDLITFNSIVQSVITDNPFACVSYMTAGVTHDPVEKTRESYTAKVVYQDAEAKTVGNDSCKFSTTAGFNAGVTALAASTALIAAHAGTAVHDEDNDTYSATIRCHDPNGELFNITFSRTRLSLTSYSDEAIRTKVETWADTVAALA
ncbi:MAG: hypothetical protein Q7U51_05780 [Methanoregula sp.]|nr:hypothetical protein [Methanoregula sp.]